MSHSANYRDTGPTTIYYQGLHEGIRQEQERIIKLLMEYLGTDPDCDCDSCSDEKTLIAIIKGEQQ